MRKTITMSNISTRQNNQESILQHLFFFLHILLLVIHFNTFLKKILLHHTCLKPHDGLGKNIKNAAPLKMFAAYVSIAKSDLSNKHPVPRCCTGCCGLLDDKH